MNGRVYDPILGVFLSPDNYIQNPAFSQNYIRFAYCVNNPLIYTDPSGEVFWTVVSAIVYGTGNLIAHSISGDIDNWEDGLKYFAEGAVAGALLGVAWEISAGTALHTGMNIYGGFQLGSAGDSAISGITNYATTGSPYRLEQSMEIFLGNFYLDENRNFGDAITQGVSRHTWEFLQTGLGHSIGQLRNTFGDIDNVEYFGGATLMNSNDNSSHKWGFTLGSFINSRNLKIENDMFRHEYGHTLQGQRWGVLYPFVIGIPSAISSNFSSNEKHRNRWYEKDANYYGEKYYRKYLSDNLTLTPWDDIKYPRY